MTTTHPPITDRAALTAVLDALDAEGIAVSVLIWAHGTSVSVVTRPAATWDAGLRVFAHLDAPDPGLRREDSADGEVVRLAGSVPGLGLAHLSLTVDIDQPTTERSNPS